MENGLIVKTSPMDVYQNMACDEFFCERMPFKYILRFFNWENQAITFGFSQRYNNVFMQISQEDRSLPITRRPTGGGIVFHKEDLTFSFIFYSPGDFNPSLTYEKLHKSINEAFKENNLPVDILSQKTKNYDTNKNIIDCFSKPVEKDIMIGSKKILGGALRKFSDYMLYQASLQIEDARTNSEFYQSIIIKALSKGYGVNLKEISLTNKDMEIINQITYNKYKKEDWIKRI